MVITSGRSMLGLLFVLMASGANAQNTFPSTGNVGVGTNSPTTPLQVSVGGVGTTKIMGPNLELNNFSSEYNLLVSSGNFSIQNDSDSGAPIRFTVQGGTGNVGIGTTSPQQLIHIATAAANSLQWAQVLQNPGDYGSSTGVGVGLQFKASTYAAGNSTENSKWSGIAGIADVGSTAGDFFGLSFYTHNGVAVAPSEVMRVTAAGNLGVGTTSPGAKLEVDGNVKLTSGSGSSLTFQDGSVQSVAWNGVLSGGDYAESVDVSNVAANYQPGDVLIVDSDEDGRFAKSTQPYSTQVTGVYSTRPGVVGRRQKTDKSNMKFEVPMAMTGIVPVKVTTENGPICRGDLLVSSSKPGYAMKGTDRTKMFGAVIGKSLGHLETGSGSVEAAIILQ